jgi:integrase/recombinase XerC
VHAHPAPGTPRKRKKRKLPKILSTGEAVRLLELADDGTERGTRDRLALELMYRAGLRVGELVTLELRDIERDGVIRLYDAKGGDGTAYFDPDRIVPLLDRWLAVRERWLGQDGEDLGYPLFVRKDGGCITARYLQRLVKRLKEEAGIHGVCTPHVLRHTFATELLEEGLTISQVQAALRHANIQTTAVYLHVRDEALRKRIAQRGRISS